MITLDDLATPNSPEPTRATAATPAGWLRDGFVIERDFFPAELVAAYRGRFAADAVERGYQLEDQLARGYGIGTPYLDIDEMKDLCLYEPLSALLTTLHGEEMGLHLNLSGWRSTTREWHVDSYLNPPYVGSWYAAAWIALDDIHADAGPFEYVPGSHLWPPVDQAKMLAALGEDGSDPDWPWRSEAILGPMYDREIINRGGHVERFIAKKGDLLIWHPFLVHRGSRPANPDLFRPALISHYSAVSRRLDMDGKDRRWQNVGNVDGIYFDLRSVS